MKKLLGIILIIIIAFCVTAVIPGLIQNSEKSKDILPLN